MIVAMEVLQNLFQESLVFDDREPVFVTQIPFVEGEYGVLLPKAEFWKQLTVLLLVQTAVQIVFGLLIYQLIVLRRQTTSAALVGYSAIIPTAIYFPFWLLQIIEIQNKGLKLGVMFVPTIVVFRTLEAIHGTSPTVVETSLGSYLAYFSSLAHFEWDPETKTRRKLTSSEFIDILFNKILLRFLCLSVVLSFEKHVQYTPFPSKVAINEYHFNLDLLSPGHLGNAYMLALLTNLALGLGFELAAFSENIKGYATKPIFLNPMFTSRSPTEFWGRKWNLLIHRTLKHGVFLPARSSFPLPICVAMTFLASGLLHEQTAMILFYDPHSSKDEHAVVFFKVTAFFLWNAVFMVLDKQMGRRHYFSWLKALPTIVVSTLVVLTALPVSHWFTGDWVVGGYFDDLAMGFIHIRRL